MTFNLVQSFCNVGSISLTQSKDDTLGNLIKSPIGAKGTYIAYTAAFELLNVM